MDYTNEVQVFRQTHADVVLGKEDKAQVPPEHRQADRESHRRVEGQAGVERGVRVLRGVPQQPFLLPCFIHELSKIKDQIASETKYKHL